MTRILLVDDDAEQVLVWRQLLELAGHAVLSAGSGADAVRLLSAGQPDVLLMDLCLPKMSDGLSLIRAAAGQPHPPRIVVLSGWPEDLYDRPEAALVARILIKPVATPVLLETLKG
jgi:CheY-like chemotaxis protein